MTNLPHRVETEAPSRVLDRAIFDAVTGGVFSPESKQFWHATSLSSRAANHFTTSVDAALSLVPEGRAIHFTHFPETGTASACLFAEGSERWLDDDTESTASTPAQAICAAALKARSQS